MKKSFFSLLLSLCVGQALALPAGPSEGGAPVEGDFLRLSISAPGSTRLDILPSVRSLLPTLSGVDPNLTQELGRRLDELSAEAPPHVGAALAENGVATLDQLADWRRAKEESGASIQELKPLDALHEAVSLAAPLDPTRGRQVERQWKDHQSRVRTMVVEMIDYAEFLSHPKNGQTLDRLEQAAERAKIVNERHLYYLHAPPQTHDVNSAANAREEARHARNRINERLEMARLAAQEEKEAADAEKDAGREGPLYNFPILSTVKELLSRTETNRSGAAPDSSKGQTEPLDPLDVFLRAERRIRVAQVNKKPTDAETFLENPGRNDGISTFQSLLENLKEIHVRRKDGLETYEIPLGAHWTAQSLEGPSMPIKGWYRYRTRSSTGDTIDVEIRHEGSPKLIIISSENLFIFAEEVEGPPGA